MRLNQRNLEYYVLKNHGRTAHQIFDLKYTSLGLRNLIIDDVFRSFSGYAVTEHGLVHLKNKQDRFPSYTSRHMYSADDLMADVNRTSRKRKRPLNRIKLKWKKTKKKFEIQKHYKLQIKKNRQQYLKMWSRELPKERGLERFNERNKGLKKKRDRNMNIKR